MPNGTPSRFLETRLTCTDDRLNGLLPVLRAALSGSGPALALSDDVPQSHRKSTVGPSPGDLVGAPIPLVGADDDSADPTAVAVRTSGSTGAAKHVLLSSSALLSSAAAAHDRLGGSGRWLLALPAQHVAGLQVLVRSLVAGTTPVVMDLTSGFTPAGFAEATARLKGQRLYTSLVPTQLVRLLDSPEVDALRRYDAILVGGAAAGPALLERAAAAGVRLVTTYGMSETAGGCVYDGVPLDGVQITLDEPDGRIRIAGPVLARGYLGDPEGTEAAFGTRPRQFVTSDHGSWQEGRLQIGGRLDSVIISGGLNIVPGPLEDALGHLSGVAEAVVVGLPDPEWGQRVAAAIVLSPGAVPPTLAEVRAAVRQFADPRSAPRQLTVLESLPLRGPGKPDRSAIAQTLVSTPPTEVLRGS
ncbi:O-succinylbenzoic acid--CoA ligase [Kineosporia sp. NBRC 101677]|uniref:o-succinylbenzoate--CoA ligase n=1 Tax=Kineosporia sp. NBRC 101677 TaxID=3032197 RepID=UPI0024A1EF65|nr:o-succinylbenzoate--CoA ligase [Kineosporia sp. NBRC 101677]GLY13294.1 O-succinylbenzoic acid--CoA ligase [Kineosporia sp. NBRC 101677]